MDNDEFEKRMRALEYFHGLRALPGARVVISCLRAASTL
jgi:hypothetical protein